MVADPFASMPNVELIEACLNGHSHAWEALLVRYQRLIYSIPFRYGLSVPDADDIFQNVSLILLQNLARLRDRERLGAWLITATRRECWRTLRHNEQNGPLADLQELEDQAASKQHLDEDFLDLEGQSIVRSAVALLGAPCR
jgi:RNA polymerase sigma factor (sigma-70 family)